MTFYSVFQKALSVVRFSTPTDDYQSIIDAHKACSYFRMDEFVALYEDAERGRFTDYGTITAMRWCDNFETWIYSIVLRSGQTAEAPSYRIRDVSSGERQQLFRMQQFGPILEDKS